MRKTLPSQHCYLVGGAVRDQLLGRPVQERDWVVIGHTAEQMQMAGFQQVGRNFPVFLHPKTREEYALARTERKQGKGHTGFICHAAPDVTLEQDLMRRDITINAMAIDYQGHLIDPYHGQQDLKNRILRHVSNAFIEDPLRVLRVARFAAQLADYHFTVAPETLTLMQNMSLSGELVNLAKERIWQEWVKALSSVQPEQFFKALNTCQAMPMLLPDPGQLDLTSLSAACHISTDFSIRFVALSHQIDQIEKVLPIQKSLIALHRLVNQQLHAFMQFETAEQILDLLYAIDAYRRPQRITPFITVCQAICQAHHKTTNHGTLLNQAWQLTKHVSAQNLSKSIQGAQVRQALYTIRLERLQEYLKNE